MMKKIMNKGDFTTMADVKNATVTIEEFEAVKAELEQVKGELEQYKAAYKDQGERYNRLFGLFANNIDYFVAGKTNK